MLANFSTVFPITAFADDEIPSKAESQNSTEKNGHRYQVFDESMSWTDAKIYCENLGGHLVTINSEEEQKFLVQRKHILSVYHELLQKSHGLG